MQRLPWAPPHNGCKFPSWKRSKGAPDRATLLGELGLNVTICIAAKIHAPRYIVAVSDRMMSFDDQIPSADDAVVKTLSISRHWVLMFAATDTTRAWAVVRKVRERVRGFTDESAETMTAAVREVYANEVRHQIFVRYLERIGFSSVDQFRSEGPALPTRDFSRILKCLDRFNLGVQLLLCGIDPRQSTSHIIEIENPGIESDHSLAGYWAIGSGTHMATASLTGRPLDQFSVETLVYRLCEAKFCAETASGVGKSTNVLLIDDAGSHRHLPTSSVRKIREIWESARASPGPPEALHEIIKAFQLERR